MGKFFTKEAKGKAPPKKAAPPPKKAAPKAPAPAVKEVKGGSNVVQTKSMKYKRSSKSSGESKGVKTFKARFSKGFASLRAAYGKKAKAIASRAEAIANDRKNLVRSDYDRSDKGDPNSIMEHTMEIPEGQARVEEAAKQFLAKSKSAKITGLPSGGSGQNG